MRILLVGLAFVVMACGSTTTSRRSEVTTQRDTIVAVPDTVYVNQALEYYPNYQVSPEDSARIVDEFKNKGLQGILKGEGPAHGGWARVEVDLGKMKVEAWVKPDTITMVQVDTLTVTNVETVTKTPGFFDEALSLLKLLGIGGFVVALIMLVLRILGK